MNNITEYKELDLAKTNFIATISHELKTPISSIKLSLKLLEDARVGTVNPEQKKLIDTMKDESKVFKITGELLDLAQVETGNIQLQKQLRSRRQLYRMLVMLLHFRQNKKILLLGTRAGEGELSNVVCDVEKTAWVLVNFLSNAVRYSPEDAKIIIKFRKYYDAATPVVQFSVQDFGRGIDPKYQPKILRNSIRCRVLIRRIPVQGLDLQSAKNLSKAQGGTIGLVSGRSRDGKYVYVYVAG